MMKIVAILALVAVATAAPAPGNIIATAGILPASTGPLTYAVAPVAVAHAAPVAYATPVAVAHAAPVAYTTGVKVVQTVEPVEQHGYKIVY